MDDTDCEIIKTLYRDGRHSYEDLAKRIDLTGNSVRKRIQSMVDRGIFKFCLIINPTLFGYHIDIAFFEKTGDQSEPMLKNLGNIEEIMFILNFIGDSLVVVFLYKDEKEKRDVLEKITKKLQSAGLSFVFSYPKPSKEFKIRDIDYKIIQNLREDPRKSIHQLSSELQSSTKTIQKRLKNLISEDIIFPTIILQPSVMENIIPYYLIIDLGNSQMVTNFGLNGDPIKFFYKQRIPNTSLYIAQLYGHSWKDVDNTLRQLKKNEKIRSLSYLFPSKIFFFDNYSQKLWMEK
jgi:DNA-binding Lrp family transcriptional regulator